MNNFNATGIRLSFAPGLGWSAQLKVFQMADGSSLPVEWMVGPRYAGDLSRVVDLAQECAASLGVAYTNDPTPTLYVEGDGEDPLVRLPLNWRSAVADECERLGWRFVYGAPAQTANATQPGPDDAESEPGYWALYDKPGAKEAALEMDKAFNEACQMRNFTRASNHMDAVKKKFEHLGANDTMVRELVLDRLDQHFGEDGLPLKARPVSSVPITTPDAQRQAPSSEVSNPDVRSLRLTVDVDYLLNGTSLTAARVMLRDVIKEGMVNGIFTGNTSAEVDDFSVSIEEITPAMASHTMKSQQRLDAASPVDRPRG